jgi:hypothetical protein
MKKRLLSTLPFMTLLLLLSLFPAAAQDTSPAQQGGWTTGAPMPTRRSELASAIIDNFIYVAGGIGEAWSIRSEVERYDIAADTWTTVAALPVGLHHLGMAALDRLIYVTGGYSNMDFTVDQAATYVYDPAADSWTQVADMPAPRAAHGMATLNGKLIVVGGVGPRAEETWMYDPVTDTWDNSAPPMPSPREHLAVIGMENLFYAIGGRIDGTNFGIIEQYEPEFGRWTSLTPMPTARGGLTAAAIDGVFHVTGGELFEPASTYNQHEAFKYGEWTTLEPMPTARHGLTSVAYQGRWYVIGGATEATGRTAETATNLLEIYTVRASYPANTRTGISMVDTVFAAMLSGDVDTLVNVTQFLTLNCIAEPQGLGGPPLCAEGEPDGTPLEVLPVASSEGTYVRRADIAAQYPVAPYSLLAVYRVADDVRQDETFPAGDYAMVFIDDGRSFFNAVVLRVTDAGIVRIDYNSWPDVLNGFDIGEFILPPLVPVPAAPAP